MYVCEFIKLRITAQSRSNIITFKAPRMDPPEGGDVCVCPLNTLTDRAPIIISILAEVHWQKAADGSFLGGAVDRLKTAPRLEPPLVSRMVVSCLPEMLPEFKHLAHD